MSNETDIMLQHTAIEKAQDLGRNEVDDKTTDIWKEHYRLDGTIACKCRYEGDILKEVIYDPDTDHPHRIVI